MSMEIKIDVNSDQGNLGKTTAAVIIARALKEAFPHINVTIKDWEQNGVAALLASDHKLHINATSIVIVDNARMHNKAVNEGYGDSVTTIVVEGQLFNDSTSLLIEAYARGEARGGMEWSDVDKAMARAMQERPDAYDECLEGIMAEERFQTELQAIKDKRTVERIAVQTQEVMDRTAKEFGLTKTKDND